MLQFEEPMLILEEDLLDHNETHDDHGDEDLLLLLNETDHTGNHTDEHGDEDDHMDEHDDEHEDEHHDDEHEDEHHDDEHEDEHHDDEHEDEHHDDEHDDEHDHGSEASSSFLDDHDDHSSDKPWGEVIVASILINLVTLSGVIFVTGEMVAKHVFKRDVAHSKFYHAFTHNIIPSFACGALLATTVFLVLPESLYLITAHFAGGEEGHEGHRFMEEEDHDDHGGDGEAVWRFGACIIAGFLLPVMTSMMFPHSHKAIEDDSHASPGTITLEETDKLRGVPEDVAVEEGIPEEKAGALSASNATKNQLVKKTSNMTADSAGSSDGSDVGGTNKDKTLPHAIDYSLAASIMAGDFFHNFAGTILLFDPS
jgi:hypothetical protein